MQPRMLRRGLVLFAAVALSAAPAATQERPLIAAGPAAASTSAGGEHARTSAAAAPANATSSYGTAEPALPPYRAERVSDHVLVISIDGLRPDALIEYGPETLTRLMREGSASMSAMTVMPSKTLPSHTSMLTGVGPEVHGISWNRLDQDAAEYVAVPTIFDLAHEAGLSTAAFASKAKFRHLLRPESFDYVQAPPSNAVNWMATRTVGDAVRYLRHESPDLMFVHVGEPDYAGHAMGWMSSVYGWAVREADAGVARVLEAADEAFGSGRYTVIVTADHGGHERTHGSPEPSDRTIPWIAWGQGVEAGSELLPGIRTMDTGATALWLLGVPVPTDWAGRPVLSAFSRWADAGPVAPVSGTAALN